MKKIKITHKHNPIGWEEKISDSNAQAWVDQMIQEQAFGKPERWVLHKDEPTAEAYDDADVLEERTDVLQPAVDAVMELVSPAIPAVDAVLDEQGVEISPAVPAVDAVYSEVSPAVPAVEQKWVKLKSEYTVEIIDLDQDPAWLLEQCHAKRRAEYPSLGEFADAYVKLQGGDPSQMDAYVAACVATKQKYPKP